MCLVIISLLDSETLKMVIGNTPLVSIDICLECKGQMLLGKRKNEPLKGIWFTPGGRIYKNEKWQDCLIRVALTELGLSIQSEDKFILMGLWDHFYPNSVFDQNSSTHYVNLPHYACIDYKPNIRVDDQHIMFKWFDLEVIINEDTFHPYIKNYAIWINDMKETKNKKNGDNLSVSNLPL
jgi:colanic acid biosynthesis protein WcaH